MLKVKILNPLATAPTIAHPGEDLGYDVYALRQQGQPLNADGTPMTYNPPPPGQPTRINFNGKIVQPIRIQAGIPTIIDTGISAHFIGPEGSDELQFGLLIRDRSSIAKKGIFVTAGVVDAGYRGEIKIMLNLSGTGGYVDLWPGDKIAQLIPIPVFADEVSTVLELEESKRQEDGFGSSGQ